MNNKKYQLLKNHRQNTLKHSQKPLIVTVEVIGSDESLKYWILYNGLKQDNLFKEKLGCKKAHNMKDLLN